MKQTLVLFAILSIFLSSCVKEEPPVGPFLPRITVIDDYDITSDTVWEGNNVYVVRENIFISNSATLTIEPGAIIKFESRTGMFVSFGGNSSIQAIGTKEKRIIFTSDESRTTSGEWIGIKHLDLNSESVFEYCTIEYAGQYLDSYDKPSSIEFNGSFLTMNNCTIRYSSGNAVKMGSSFCKFKSFKNNLITEEIHSPLSINANSVSSIGTGNLFDDKSQISVIGSLFQNGDHIWQNTEAAYSIDDNFAVFSKTGGSCNLILTPGVQILCSDNFYIGTSSIPANLIANGTPDNPIIFSSRLDINESRPGDWNGIIFNKTTPNNSLLNHCIITNGGSSWSNISMSDMADNPVTISNCIIKNSNNYGIYKTSFAATPILSNNTFENNASGDKNW